ncbi:restriction endonuclease subunit S [Brevibacillus laterosporus]|nr:restriction endonuclease subunit S [Brevibacillus laterosporus]MED1662776.1 restriction endonuclease subunit S [Brevibacillus laterosporus]MED1669098.1 restriction endonuclease subunit S [Brevibacillus laterosporus]MED1720573.1 restriction endonuclease subunit S [Brevibacillus laterosporus]
MSKWEKVKLGEVCDVRDGTHDSPKYVLSGYPLITSKNISNGYIDLSEVNYISKEDYDKINARSFVDNGDILMPMIGTIGKPIVVDKQFDFAIKNVALCKFNKETAINSYIYYLLKSDLFIRYINKENRGGTQKFLSLGSIRSFVFPLPPLEVQKQIAQNLDTVSELLALRKKQLEELDELIKSVFYDMFGDPVTNDKGWEIRKLKDITVSIQSGNTPKGGKQVYVNSGIMFFRSQNVWRNRIEINDIAYIDEKTHKKMGKTSLKHKDILITKTGRFNTENSSLGRAALFLGEDRSANINGHVYLVRLKEGYVHEFVLYILVTDEYKDYIRKVCVGGIDKRQINKEHLEEFPIIIPPFSLQNEFATIVTKIEEQKALVKQSIEETQQLFDSLMSQYFD